MVLVIVVTVMLATLGAMFILTARYAFKPLVETLAKALRESGYSHPPQQLQNSAELVEQIESLRDEVRQLRDVQDFDKKLLASNTADGVDFRR